LIRDSADIIGTEAAMPTWTDNELQTMNERFTEAFATSPSTRFGTLHPIKALTDALAAGLEQCATAISTKACTRYPVHNYRRPDTN
jgi:hypothetical protein